MDTTVLPAICPAYVDKLSLYYSKIISHAITGDGKYLLALIKSGSLALFPLKKYLTDFILKKAGDLTTEESIVDPNRLKPIQLISVANFLCLALDPSSNCFVLGGKGSLKGHHFLKNLECSEDWTIRLSSDCTLANAIEISEEKIFTGCSDNHIYVYDKETHSELHKLVGHQDYIHCLKLSHSSSLLYSGSEDGSVRIWDTRASNESISVIVPFKKSHIERDRFGKWIGALDVSPNGEWLVCGGGPLPSMWHLRSNKCVHVLDTPLGVCHVAQFNQHQPSSILTAGSGNQVNLFEMANTSIVNRINSSIDNIYTISNHCFEDLDYNLYSFAGDSFKIELCKNAKFIDCNLFVS